MSHAIDDNEVVAVLLAGGWIDVKGGTFEIDAYEFFQPPIRRVAGRPWDPGNEGLISCSAGGWIGKDGFEYVAPMNAILALKIKKGSTRKRRPE